MELHADVLLMDDQEGVAVARNKGFEVIGTLGILGRAAQRQLLDLADAFDRLKRTNFFIVGRKSWINTLPRFLAQSDRWPTCH